MWEPSPADRSAASSLVTRYVVANHLLDAYVLIFAGLWVGRTG